MLDITTTATIRPALFHQTLKSFTDNLFTNRKEYRLILNVDPIGEDVDPMEMVKVGKQFFDNVVYNIPDEPNFAQACKWCWSNTSSEFVFHIEDDWRLCKVISIDHMIEILKNNDDLLSLRLPKRRVKEFPKSYGFRRRKKVGLNPTLWKGDIIRSICSNMNVTDNPEKQVQVSHRDYKNNGFTSGMYFEKDVKGKYVKDIGRAWMKDSDFGKRKGSNFVNWRND